jgi:hypothetical protein
MQPASQSQRHWLEAPEGLERPAPPPTPAQENAQEDTRLSTPQGLQDISPLTTPTPLTSEKTHQLQSIDEVLRPHGRRHRQRLHLRQQDDLFDGVDRTRAFDNDYDLDMHEPGD